MRLNRRELLRASASALCTAGVWPGVLAARDHDPGSCLSFLVVNDTHYLDRRCGPWLEGAVRQMKGHRESIDFCLMLGDLGEHGRSNQIGPLLDIFKGLRMPVYYVVGNHDYVTQTDRSPFESLVTRRVNYDFEHR